MTLRTVLIVTLALIFGVSAAAVAVTIKTGDRPEAPVIEKVPVVVATVKVERGTVITPELVAVKEILREDVPPAAIQSVNEAVGKIVDVTLLKDNLVLQDNLTTGPQAGLPAVIPTGMRGVTIQTKNVASGLAGFVRPDNRVDVLLTTDKFHAEDKSGGGTVTLLHNVKVLAVDSRMEPSSATGADGKVVEQREPRSVTLLVTPEQAALLNLGQQKGELALALRNPRDESAVQLPPVDVRRLPFPPPPKPPVVEQPRPQEQPKVVEQPKQEAPAQPRLFLGRGTITQHG